MSKKTIPQNKLAHNAHIKLLKKMQKQAESVFLHFAHHIIKDIITQLSSEKLVKSDQMPKGWTGKISKLEFDVEAIVSRVMDKYALAMKWVMFGDAAGKKAADAAAELKIKRMTTPGVVIASYLDSIDAHNRHFHDLFGSTTPFSKALMTSSMDLIKDQSLRHLDDFVNKFSSNLISSISKIVDLTNTNFMNEVLVGAHESDNNRIHVVGAVDKDLFMPREDVREILTSTVSNSAKDWSNLVESQMGTAAGAATHQAMFEVFGKRSGQVRVVLMTLEDERVCKVCEKMSKRNGEYKYYSVDQFKPAGWNYGKKTAEWSLCFPPIHHRCRCALIYVPTGMEVGPDGALQPEGKGEGVK